MNITDFLHMGGYAFYVWSSWAMTAVVIAWNIAAPIREKRQLLASLEREKRRANRT
jgi:heme exporter protein D